MTAEITFFSAAGDAAPSDAVQFSCDIMTFQFYGTWDGGQAQVEISVDGTNYEAVEDAVFTEDSNVNIEAAPACYIRANITSVGGSTSLTVVANRKQRIGVL